MKRITIGIIANVDSGKTTLSEAILYLSGSIRSFGSVDKGEAYLDNSELEKKRGITIFSRPARLTWGETEFILIDTPGHADFSAETERTFSVLDYAVLLVPAAEGMSGRTKLLWKLLKEYRIPVFVFFNKMDLRRKMEGAGEEAGTEDPAVLKIRSELVSEMNETAGGSAVDFSEYPLDSGETEAAKAPQDIFEQLAVCSEEALQEYFGTGAVSAALIRSMIRKGELAPCFFGSAARQEGVREFLTALDLLTEETVWPEEFSAQVYKIARDPDGTRLTFARITGGALAVKTVLPDGEESAKIQQIRLYSGEKYRTADSVRAGDVCALTGLKESRAGTVYGTERTVHPPVLTPVLSYRLLTREDPAEVLPALRILEEENPELSVLWEESRREIHVSVMGRIQLEVLASVLQERFGIAAEFDSGEVLYRETLAEPVIGAGHFEPLRHYAEVHVMLEPLPPGTGILVESAVSFDRLSRNWQNQILSALAKKQHKGVLTGAPLTDVKITLTAGRAHLKHTEGGDFRQAANRAVRQGLMNAESILLEPYYRFVLEIPTESVGRALTDLDRTGAEFSVPSLHEEKGMSVIEGKGPVAALKDYPAVLASYTKNRGAIHFVPEGYGPCRNAGEIIRAKAYDPLADLRNSPDSVFCMNGAGRTIPYDEIYDYLDIPFDGSEAASAEEAVPAAAREEERFLSPQEVDSIIAAYAGANRRKDKRKYAKRKVQVSVPQGPRPSKKSGPVLFPLEAADILYVDGYNVIFAWEELKELAKDGIGAARSALIDLLSKYSSMVESEVTVVFDAYRVKDKMRENAQMAGVRIVFTEEDETADRYIERATNLEDRNRKVAVVTSDNAEQIVAGGHGSMIVSSSEFQKRFRALEKELKENYGIQ